MMNCFRQAARTVIFGSLVFVLGGCPGSRISDQELQEVLKPFFETSNQLAKEEALAAAEETALGVSMGSLRETRTDPTSERARRMLYLLRALRYEIPWGLTDAELQRLARKGLFGGNSKIEAQIDKLFDSDLVTQDLKVLGELGPDDAFTFVTFVCKARVVRRGFLPQGASSTTWAAMNLASVVYELKLSRLATRSPVVKLFIEGGALTLPMETHVQFGWSGAKSISIELPPIVWYKADIAEIESSVNQETIERYADALERAREKTQ